jgi:hypothetical protein
VTSLTQSSARRGMERLSNKSHTIHRSRRIERGASIGGPDDHRPAPCEEAQDAVAACNTCVFVKSSAARRFSTVGTERVEKD